MTDRLRVHRLGRAKRDDFSLQQAFQEIRRRRPARLLILGAIRSTDRSGFDRTIATMPDVREDMILTEHIDDRRLVAQYLQVADVFLLSSLCDGLPNSLLEATAGGVPVVASDAEAIRPATVKITPMRSQVQTVWM